MIRRLVPAAVLAAALIGCGKKVEVPGVGTVGGDGTSAEKPDAAYTITVREKQPGDRFEVTEQLSSTARTEQEAGKKSSVESSSGAKYDYTEVVEEVKDGRPTKAKRTYKAAELKKDGKSHAASFAGRTVDVLLLKSGLYSFRIEKGGEVPAAEREHFTMDFGGKDRMSSLLPKREVKVNETFALDQGQLDQMMPALIQGKVRPTGDGRLTKAYTKDGRRCGVVELGINVNLPAGPETGVLEGSGVNTVVVYDGCIDGSVTDGEIKMTRVENLTIRNAKTGATLKRNTETVRAVTVRPIAKP
jgi:hypothetical protein